MLSRVGGPQGILKPAPPELHVTVRGPDGDAPRRGYRHRRPGRPGAPLHRLNPSSIARYGGEG
jgi:hypothetical protein